MEVKRYELLNHLIDTYNFVNYLEIGVWAGECIKKIKAEHKDGVDPGIEGNIHEYLPDECNYKISSDRFFELIEGEDIKYDLIFIDGLHHHQQVKKDIENSLKHLQPYGMIMLHDCNPQTYESQVVPRMSSTWHGDVWKAYVEFKHTHPQFETYVVDTDCGCGIIVNNENHSKLPWDFDIEYKELEKNRVELLNLISVDKFKEIFS
tara:strand:+ start:659 stop:1276 length:618 start_codon:yes stop_codon:yes gene_type:complete